MPLTSPVDAISHLNKGSASRNLGHENIGACDERENKQEIKYKYWDEENYIGLYVQWWKTKTKYQWKIKKRGKEVLIFMK